MDLAVLADKCPTLIIPIPIMCHIFIFSFQYLEKHQKRDEEQEGCKTGRDGCMFLTLHSRVLGILGMRECGNANFIQERGNMKEQEH